MQSFAFACLVWLCGAITVNAITLDFGDLFEEPPVRGTLQIASVSSDQDTGRCILSASVLAPNFFGDLDIFMIDQGNLGSSRKRLYWVGVTRLQSASSEILRATTRARFEVWLYAFGGKTRIGEDTKSVGLEVQLQWNQEHKRLTVRRRITNIQNFPNWAEDLFNLGDYDHHHLDLRETEGIASLEPALVAPPEFLAANEGLGIEISFSISMNLPEITLIPDGPAWLAPFSVDTCVALADAVEKSHEAAKDLFNTLGREF